MGCREIQTCQEGDVDVPYWWEADSAEKFWVEIRYVDGIGESLRCSVTDESGGANPWYDLVAEVSPGDVIYHWNAHEHRFVGRSEVAAPVTVAGSARTVQLRDFTPLRVIIDLDTVRQHEEQLRNLRESLQQQFPDQHLYLPFQYRADGLRMLSNYFAKLPRSVVELLFDDTGIGEASLPPPPSDEGPPGEPEGPPSRYGFLKPFQSKQDGWYQAHIAGGIQRRSRKHETLVNSFAAWLESKGIHGLGRNAAIDLGVVRPPAIIEAKVVGASWPPAIRAAVGQLYEYRFFKVADPAAELIFLADKPVPADWIHYLENDRNIGAAWPTGSGFALSPLARHALRLGDSRVGILR